MVTLVSFVRGVLVVMLEQVVLAVVWAAVGAALG
jgi:hypothetical protein